MKQINIKHDFSLEKVTVTNRECKVCDKKFFFYTAYAPQIPDNNACDECQYWMSIWTIRNQGEVVIYNGNYYMIDDVVKESYPNKITVQFDNGKTVYTNHLWEYQHVPVLWQMLGLYDNAVVKVN